MKLFINLLFLTFISLSSFSQVVVNKKGTVITVDSSKWTLSGTDIYNKNSGNVGIGNPSPLYKLDITGKVRLSDSLITNTARISTLNSGTTNDSFVVAGASNGILKRIALSRLVATIDTATMLSTYLRKVDTTAMLTNYVVSANNGLTKAAKNIELGGSLTKNTTIAQAANKLIFTSTAVDGFSVDGTTLSVDGSNNRVGIGTAAPNTSLEINSGVANTSGLRFSNLTSASPTSSGASIGVNSSGDVVTVPTTAVYTNASAAVSISSLTLTAVSGLSFSVTSGKNYKVKIIGAYQSNTAATGGRLGFVLTSGSGSIVGMAQGEIASSTSSAVGIATGLRVTLKTINNTIATIGSYLQTSAVNPINQPHFIGADFVFNCTGTGTFQVLWASETTSGTTQLNAGSTMFVDEY